MAHTPRDWRNRPDPSTPLEATQLEDLETRLGAYADSVGAGGIELGYAEKLTNATSTSATPADVTGLSITVTIGTRPIRLEIGGTIAGSAAGTLPAVTVVESSTTYVTMTSLGTTNIGFTRAARAAPSAGTHTFKVQLANVTASGTATLAGASSNPSYIWAIEI